MFMLPINHAHQLQLATATPEEKNITYTIQHFCDVYCFVPNLHYWPNIRQHFLAEYSFSAETRKFVFGLSLVLRRQCNDSQSSTHPSRRICHTISHLSGCGEGMMGVQRQRKVVRSSK
jgi:hypothetical protein